jgi:hypothetical protein
MRPRFWSFATPSGPELRRLPDPLDGFTMPAALGMPLHRRNGVLEMDEASPVPPAAEAPDFDLSFVSTFGH